MRGGADITFNDALWFFLAVAAWIDFTHDFNEHRAAINVGTLNDDPYGPVPGNKIKRIAELLASIREGGSKTAYNVFKDMFMNLLVGPRQIGVAVEEFRRQNKMLPGQLIKEEDVLTLANIPYKLIIGKLGGTSTEPRSQWDTHISNINPDGGDTWRFGREGTQSTYKLRAMVTKDSSLRPDPQKHLTRVLSTLMETEVIVIMFDAAGCELNFGDAWKGGWVPEKAYHVFIVNNKENIADPATKPTYRNVTKALGVSRENTNVCIYFLEEAEWGHVASYPAYFNGMPDQNGVFFSNFNERTMRAGTPETPYVRAELSPPGGGDPVVINNVKDDSEVAAATKRALTLLLQGNPDAALTAFLEKRGGDWKQAISLLDKTRKYRVVHVQGTAARLMFRARALDVIKSEADKATKIDTITLADLEGELKGSSVLLTLDRVLLAIAVFLKLNVGFTTNRGELKWLIYLQNMDLAKYDDAATLLEQAPGVLAKITEYEQYVIGHRGQTEVLASLFNVSDIRTYATEIPALRGALIQSATLPSSSSVKDTLYKVKTANDWLKDIMTKAGNDVVRIYNTPELKKDLIGHLTTLRGGVAYAVNADAKMKKVGEWEAAPNSLYPTRLQETAAIESFVESLKTGREIPASNTYFVVFKSIFDRIGEDMMRCEITSPTVEPDVISNNYDRAAAESVAAAVPGADVFRPQAALKRTRQVTTPIPPLVGLFVHYNKVIPHSLSGVAVAKGGQRGGAGAFIYMFVGSDGVKVAFEQDRNRAVQNDGTYITAVFGGNITNESGFQASVIDEYVFYDPRSIERYIVNFNDDAGASILPPESQLVAASLAQETYAYALVRYVLWCHDDVRNRLKELGDVDIENTFAIRQLVTLNNRLSVMSDIFTNGGGAPLAFESGVKLLLTPMVASEDQVSAYQDGGWNTEKDVDAVRNALKTIRSNIFALYATSVSLQSIGYAVIPQPGYLTALMAAQDANENVMTKIVEVETIADETGHPEAFSAYLDALERNDGSAEGLYQQALQAIQPLLALRSQPAAPPVMQLRSGNTASPFNRPLGGRRKTRRRGLPKLI
jgi:hypothetical protein